MAHTRRAKFRSTRSSRALISAAPCPRALPLPVSLLSLRSRSRTSLSEPLGALSWLLDSCLAGGVLVLRCRWALRSTKRISDFSSLSSILSRITITRRSPLTGRKTAARSRVSWLSRYAVNWTHSVDATHTICARLPFRTRLKLCSNNSKPCTSNSSHLTKSFRSKLLAWRHRVLVHTVAYTALYPLAWVSVPLPALSPLWVNLDS